MAKSKKAKPSAGVKRKKLTRSVLVAVASGTSFPVTVNITFIGGFGQATVVLFRNGLLINMQSVSLSADVHFADVESRDSIAVNGVCAGSATVTIDVSTNPATPESFTKIILGGYTIL
jgi:hypothetical protein